MRVGTLAIVLLFGGLLLFGCTQETPEKTDAPEKPVDAAVLKLYPLDSKANVIHQDHVVFDAQQTKDGKGSLRITATEPIRIRLFEVGDLALSNTKLLYTAHLRSENLDGKAYLEMLCTFPGKGEFFSRALGSALSGNMGWVSQETPFFLKEGEDPSNIKLNLVIEGKGMVWIDDVRLLKEPLS